MIYTVFRVSCFFLMQHGVNVALFHLSVVFLLVCKYVLCLHHLVKFHHFLDMSVRLSVIQVKLP